MGRYRQWLHHQEIEQQLHSHLQHLKAELSRLQGHAMMYDSTKNTISMENQLFIALAASMHTNTLPTVSSDISDGYSLFSPTQRFPVSLPESMTTTPFTENPSSDIALSPIDESQAQFTPQTAIPDTPPVGAAFMTPFILPDAEHSTGVRWQDGEDLTPSHPHDELALQPEDMMLSFDAQPPTEPQLALPHWLHSLIESSLYNNQGTSTMNEETLRSNRLFQRWSERWGLSSSAPSTKSNTVKRQTPRKEGEP